MDNTVMEKSFWQEFIETMQPFTNHYSDLYIRRTPENIVLCRKHKKSISGFTNQVTKEPNIDVAFGYPQYFAHKKEEIPKVIALKPDSKIKFYYFPFDKFVAVDDYINMTPIALNVESKEDAVVFLQEKYEKISVVE